MSIRITTTLLALAIAVPYAPARADTQPAAGQQAARGIGETPHGLAGLIGSQADEKDLKRLGYDWV